MTLIALAALSASLTATSLAPPESREMASTNGRFKIHVNVDSGTHKITGEFALAAQPWDFKHDASFHDFFVSDDGQAAAVVNWRWCGGFGLEPDSPAVVIYGRAGVTRSYTYNQLSKPRERKPDEIGPIGDFWRVWRDDATIHGNLLTINVAGGKPCVIDLRNPQDLPPLEAGNAEKAPQTPEEMGKNLRASEVEESESRAAEKPKIDPEFLALKARETAEIEASFPALETLLGTISEPSQLTVLGNHFGLMGQTMQGADDQKSPEVKRAVEERRGGSFYVTPYKLTAEEARSIKTIIRDIRSYSKTTDPLARAGFNSCYALVFETNGSVTEIQISTGNHKIRAFHKEVDIYSYLTPEADKKLHEILGKYGSR